MALGQKLRLESASAEQIVAKTEEDRGSSRELVLPSETITFRETVKEQVSPLNNITKKNLLYPMVYQVEATSSDSMKREASFVHLFVRSSVLSFVPFFRSSVFRFY